MKIPHITAFDTYDFTIDAGFRVNDLSPGTQVIAHRESGTILYVTDMGMLRFRVLGKDASGGDMAQGVDTPEGVIVPGQWHHVAATYYGQSDDTTYIVLVVDGTQYLSQVARAPVGDAILPAAGKATKKAKRAKKAKKAKR